MKECSFLRLVFSAWLLAGIAVHSACAQDSEVSGQILDPSLSAVAGAQVALTRIDTGEQRQTVSNNEGYYTFPLLLPGPYQLKVEKQGFAVQTQTGITVETASVSTIDVTLAVGSFSQLITVNSSPPLLQTETSAVAHVVEHQTIVDLPLIDRRSEQLTRLNGFVVQNAVGSNATFAIAGGRGNNANYFIDGGSAQNLNLGVATLVFDPPVEAMQEFNIALSNYSAELGRSGGGVVQITTRSGTNQFHGSLYEYFRNDALQARTFNFTPLTLPKPALRYNLFGVSLGGPINKDKTQFFFNYEGKRQKSGVPRLLNVPSQQEVQGDFSALCGPGPNCKVPVYDPMSPPTCTAAKPPVCTPTPFPGNIIPPQRIDLIGAKLAAFYPPPNVPYKAPDASNFLANDPTDSPYDAYVARIDHAFREQDRVFGRLLAQTDHTLTASIFPTPGTDSFGMLVHDYYYNASGTWDHIFSPSAINEFRYTYTRRQFLSTSAGANTTIGQQLGLKYVNPSFFPSVTVTVDAPLGSSLQQRLQTPIRSDQYADSVTMMRGNHQLKYGLEYRYSSNVDRFSPSPGGAFTFNNIATGGSTGLPALLLGYVNSASVLATNPLHPLHSRSDSYGAFVQDDWRVAPNLTLNLGLRWDTDAPRWETNNQQNSFDPTAINPVSGTPGIVTFSGRNGLSKYANDWDLDNFGPRVGFAWKPKEQWVVRGGGAILYPGEYDSATPTDASLGFATEGSWVSMNAGTAQAFILHTGPPTPPFCPMPEPPFCPMSDSLTPGLGAVMVGQPNTAVTFFERNRQTGYLYQASLDVQRQFKGNWLVDVGYLGTFGHRLASPDPQSINQIPPDKLAELASGEQKKKNALSLRPFPQYSNVQIIAADIGNSNYNGLNIGLEKRYSAGLSLTANYTYSQFIDNLDARNELAAYPGTNAFTNYYDQASDKGRSGNDVPQRFVLGTIYDLPVGYGRHYVPRAAWASELVGGWTVGLITEARSGTPLSPVMATNNTFSFSQGDRPDVVGNPNLPGSRPLGQKLAEWFNTTTFTKPADYTFGTAGRTFGEGPGALSLDASLLKNFNIREKAGLEVRVEMLNFLNHPIFANPNTVCNVPSGSTACDTSTFGHITSLMPGNQSRIIQLGLHLKF